MCAFGWEGSGLCCQFFSSLSPVSLCVCFMIKNMAWILENNSFIPFCEEQLLNLRFYINLCLNLNIIIKPLALICSILLRSFSFAFVGTLFIIYFLLLYSSLCRTYCALSNNQYHRSPPFWLILIFSLFFPPNSFAITAFNFNPHSNILLFHTSFF